ncbi:MAG: hypothetical protein SFU98_20435 [Leptospiraceae bacterium]|nr:hypothetical protein [Leptospiraceae bacterium]
MKYFISYCILSLLSFGCLRAKKSAFDISNPQLLFFSFFSAQQQQQQNPEFSIGGSITGFTSGNLILQLNGGNDIILNPSNSYQVGKVASGTKYTITLKTNPNGQICSMTNSTGTATSNITNANITCNLITVTALYPSNGLNWNDYINRDFSKDIFYQPDIVCNTSNTGGYRTCVHGGEIRKFDIPTRSTCTNLTATDNLSALNWICRANSTTGGVTFYSTALKKGKYLSDLIDWTNNAWQKLTITINEGTTTFATTNSLSLWANPINITEPAIPNSSGTIYLYKTTPTAIRIDTSTDKVAILLNPNTAFTFGTTNQAIQSHARFNWFEGTVRGNSNITGLLLNTGFSVAKNFKVQSIGILSGTCSGIELSGNIGNNYLEDIVVANTNGCTSNFGIYINNTSRYNLLNNILVFNHIGTGISVDSTSTQNSFFGVTVASNSVSGIVFGSNDTVGFNITSANNNTHGIDVLSNNNSILSNLTLVNNSQMTRSGLNGITFNDPTIQNLASFSNHNGLNIAGSGTYKGLGVYKMSGNSSLNCSNAAVYIGISTTAGACNFSAPSDSISVVTTSSISSTSTFLAVPSSGSTTVTDSKNATTGLNHMSSINVTASGNDWLNFENYFRTIGRLGMVNFPNSSQNSNCTTTCSLWDFSLKSTDTVLRNANIASGCPSTMFTHTFSTGTLTILRNAVEILNDGVGNENGLCEANEDCLLTPNIGSYQGHGTIIPASTASSACPDISSQGIKLYQFENNGY